MNELHSIKIVVVVCIITAVLRFLPFWALNGKKQTPEYITYLGKVLPYAIMGMLLIYCLKEISLVNSPYGLSEISACILIAIIHTIKRNSLLSIVSGTILYMLILRLL